jgi:hypothetical protein
MHHTMRRTGPRRTILWLALLAGWLPPWTANAQEGGGCAERLTHAEVIGLLQRTRNHLGQSFPAETWAVASAVAQAESALCPNAEGAPNRNGTVDRGLFQINSVHGFGADCLFDAVCNTQAAITVYHGSLAAGYDGFRPWTVYGSGAYRAHLGDAQSAAGVALAPRFYLGAGMTRPDRGDDAFVVSPRFGVSFASGLGLRAALELHPASRRARMASAGLLYRPAGLWGLYGGVGADAHFHGDLSLGETTEYGAHALAGLELRLGPLGVFGEAQPGINLRGTLAYLNARAGVNLHF